MPDARLFPRLPQPILAAPFSARIERPWVSCQIKRFLGWDRLVTVRLPVFDPIQTMTSYLIKREILGLSNTKKHPTRRPILDLICTTSDRVSEMLALTQAGFSDVSHGFGVVLKTTEYRPSKAALLCSLKSYVHIANPLVNDRLQNYLLDGQFEQSEKYSTHRATVPSISTFTLWEPVGVPVVK